MTVNDGLAGVDAENVLVNVVDVNDEPTLIATGNNPTFTEGGAAVDCLQRRDRLDGRGRPDLHLDDAHGDQRHRRHGGQDEILTINGIDVALTNGNAVAVGAGTANVSLSGNTATVTLAGVGLTDAQLQTLIDGLTYRNTSQNPTDADRVVTITEVVDSGSSTPPADNTAAPGITSTINVDPVNDQPVLGGVDATPIYVENAAALVLDNSLTVTDVDDTNIESATVSIVAGLVAGDVLAADTTGTAITASYLNGVLTLTGSDTPAHFQEVLQKVTFESTSEDPTNGGANPTRTISWLINDGTSPSNNPALTLNVTALNDGPMNIVPPSIAVIEDVASAITGISFTDPDSNLNPVLAVLSVPSGSLAASGGGGVAVGGTSSFMTLTGTLADINTFIAGGNVTFTTAANATTDVNLAVHLDDQGNTGSGGNVVAINDVTLAVTAVNDAPVNTVPGVQVVNEDTNLGITGLSIADLDADSGTLTTTLSVGSGTLTVATVGGGATVAGSGANAVTLTGTQIQINTTLAAAGAVLYTGNADFNGADTLTMTTDDGGNTGVDPGLTPGPTSESDTDTVGITVNAVNDAPVNSLPVSVTAPPDTNQAIAGLSIADVDVGAGALITQLQVGNGILTVAPVGGAGVVGSGTNMVTLTGTLADINATLSAAGNIIYHGNAGFFDTDTLTMTTSDNGFTGSGGPLADIDLMSIQVRNAVNTDLNADSKSDIAVAEQQRHRRSVADGRHYQHLCRAHRPVQPGAELARQGHGRLQRRRQVRHRLAARQWRRRALVDGRPQCHVCRPDRPVQSGPELGDRGHRRLQRRRQGRHHLAARQRPHGDVADGRLQRHVRRCRRPVQPGGPLGHQGNRRLQRRRQGRHHLAARQWRRRGLADGRHQCHVCRCRRPVQSGPELGDQGHAATSTATARPTSCGRTTTARRRSG